MAKRSDDSTGTHAEKVSGMDAKVEEFAEDLGRMLGAARAKAEGWLGQRQEIIQQLTELRDTASTLLTDLGHEAADATRRGRRSVEAAIADVKQKRTMSMEARKAISDAQKKRWAAQKAGEK